MEKNSAFNLTLDNSLNQTPYVSNEDVVLKKLFDDRNKDFNESAFSRYLRMGKIHTINGLRDTQDWASQYFKDLGHDVGETAGTIKDGVVDNVINPIGSAFGGDFTNSKKGWFDEMTPEEKNKFRLGLGGFGLGLMGAIDKHNQTKALTDYYGHMNGNLDAQTAKVNDHIAHNKEIRSAFARI